MKKTKLHVFLMFFMLFIVNCVLLPPSVNSSSSPSIVHTDTNLNLPYTISETSFTENCSSYNRTWVFYYDDAGNNIEYKYSENGETWIQPANSPCASYELYSAHYNIYWCANLSYVYIVWITPHKAEGGDYVLLRRGQFNNSTKDFDWESVKEVHHFVAYPYGEALCPDVIVDTWNSKVIVVFGRYQTGQYLVWKLSTDLIGDSWGGLGYFSSPSTRVASPQLLWLRNDTNPLRSDIICLFYANGVLRSRRYYTINQTWGDAKSIYSSGASEVNQVSWKASYYNGTCHIVYRKIPSTGYIASKTYNKTTNTWGTEYFVTNTELVGYSQGIGIFGNSSIEYAFYSHLDKVYYCSRVSQTVNFSNHEIWLNITGLIENSFTSWLRDNENEPSYVQFVWLRVGSDILEFASFGESFYSEEEPPPLDYYIVHTNIINDGIQLTPDFFQIRIGWDWYRNNQTANLTEGTHNLHFESNIHSFINWSVSSSEEQLFFGNNSIGSYNTTTNIDRKLASYGSSFILTYPVTVTDICFYTFTTAGESNATAGIYRVTGLNITNSTLMGSTLEVTGINTTMMWRNFTFSGGLSLGAGSYAIALHGGGSGSSVRSTYEISAGNHIQWSVTDSYSDGLSDPFGSGGTNSSNTIMSAYAIYEYEPLEVGDSNSPDTTLYVYGNGVLTLYTETVPFWFPVRLTMGLLGLLIMIITPAFTVQQVYKKKNYGFFITAVILFTLAYALITCWVF